MLIRSQTKENDSTFFVNTDNVSYWEICITHDKKFALVANFTNGGYLQVCEFATRNSAIKFITRMQTALDANKGHGIGIMQVLDFENTGV